MDKRKFETLRADRRTGRFSRRAISDWPASAFGRFRLNCCSEGLRRLCAGFKEGWE